MSIQIDPKALHSFAERAATHSSDLHKLHLKLELSPTILGSFDEATELVAAINAHTGEVNQRLQATADALVGLSRAAAQAAALSGASDAEIAKQMKTINHQVDDARRSLTTHKA
jgi:hypothetical protein